MKNGKYISTAIISVISGAVLFLTVTGGEQFNFDSLKRNGSFPFKRSEPSFSVSDNLSVNTGTPLMQTDFDDVFYTINTEKNNEVSFYQYDGANSSFKQIMPTKTVPISVTYSGQTLWANVSYILRDNEITGYGLYTQSGVYNYAFFKLKTLPKSHQIDENEYLLLIDTQKDDFYKADKTFDISFYYSFEDSTATNFVYDVNATVGMDGKISDSYAIFTDEALESAKNMIPFFTSRYYAGTSLDEKFDIDINMKERAAITRLVSKAHYSYAKVTDTGTVFLRRTKTGFNSVLIPAFGEKEIVIKSFAGDYETNYLRQGDYVLNKETKEISSLLDGKTVTAQCTEIARIEYFAISSDATHCIIAGENSAKEPVIAFCDFTKGSEKTTSGNGSFTSMNANFAFINNNTVFFNRPSSENGKIYCGCVLSWDKIFG